MVVSGLSIEGNSMHNNIAVTSTSLPDYKRDEPNIFVDDEYVILPLLEDTMETSNGSDSSLCEETAIDSDDSSLYLAIHQLRSCNQESDVDSYLDSDKAECFSTHLFIRNIPDLSDAATNFQPSRLPKEARKTKSITLVLDLDGMKIVLFPGFKSFKASFLTSKSPGILNILLGVLLFVI